MRLGPALFSSESSPVFSLSIPARQRIKITSKEAKPVKSGERGSKETSGGERAVSQWQSGEKYRDVYRPTLGLQYNTKPTSSHTLLVGRGKKSKLEAKNKNYKFLT